MKSSRMTRKHLSADSLVTLLRNRFEKLTDSRSGVPTISMADAVMSAFAMFSLKDPSLLAFDKRRDDENLEALYKIKRVPSDTQMRVILDPVPPEELRPAFGDVFRAVQRGKILESFRYLDEGYLLALDGTGYFSSEKVHCPNCMEKHHADGRVSYYHQTLGAAIVHPDHAAVLPLMPEPILKQDGETKNDCERNAARRYLEKFRADHPTLQVVVVEDALSSNAPHVRDLQKYGMHFLLGVKEGDHAYLFEEVRRREEAGHCVESITVRTSEPHLEHVFTVFHDVALNESNTEVRVTFLRYIEYNNADDTLRMFTWITDLKVTKANAWHVMRAGRARWKIENETFNTLKNQGYGYEHNYGHGEENLSVVFALLMMLAFLVDQVLQMCDPLFQKALEKLGSKRLLWERMRSLFYEYRLRSLRELYEALSYGCDRPRPRIRFDTS
jgi:hypothetical protein